MKKKIVPILCLFVFLALGATAHANTIVGDLAFSYTTGVFGTGDIGLTGGSFLSNCTGFTFFHEFQNATVGTGDGVFAGSGGQTLTVTDFSFNPLGPPGTKNEIQFTYKGVTYDLTFTNVTIDGQGSHTVSLQGFGDLKDSHGNDNPNTSWTFTVSETHGRWQWGGTFGAPAPIPEPATLLLLGSGMTALVLYRSRRKKRT